MANYHIGTLQTICHIGHLYWLQLSLNRTQAGTPNYSCICYSPSVFHRAALGIIDQSLIPTDLFTMVIINWMQQSVQCIHHVLICVSHIQLMRVDLFLVHVAYN